MISVKALRGRKSTFMVGEWIMDSGAFSTLLTHGVYPYQPEEYASQIERWKSNGNLLCAVTQDYMCEPLMLDKTGLTVEDHQQLTIERYDVLQSLTSCYVMPVLQGYEPESYVEHLRMYGSRLKPNQWVGIGSICKRNWNPTSIENILLCIHEVSPALRLHGFGLKETSLRSGLVRHLLWSADSIAWSFSCRMKGCKSTPQEARAFSEKIESSSYQRHLIEGMCVSMDNGEIDL